MNLETAPAKFDDGTGGLLHWDVGVAEREFVRTIFCLSPGFDIVEYGRDHLGILKNELHRFGAILIRGLPSDTKRFIDLMDLFGPPASHSELSSLRTHLGDEVYTSTDHPADQKIVMHNEQAYLSYWPKVIGFMCVTPSRSGGQTPIADCRNFGDVIPGELAKRLREEGVKYVRNIGAEATISWKSVFGVDSPEQLEAYCAKRDIDVTWKDDRTPRTITWLPAFFQHHGTGIECFFNNIVSSSHFSLGAKQRYHVEQLFPSIEDHPNTVLWGDQTPFSQTEIEALLAGYETRSYQFDWRPGDILIADNVATAHARNAFEGQRKIVVRINDIYDALPDIRH